jgi:hypothetical protein
MHCVRKLLLLVYEYKRVPRVAVDRENDVAHFNALRHLA